MCGAMFFDRGAAGTLCLWHRNVCSANRKHDFKYSIGALSRYSIPVRKQTSVKFGSMTCADWMRWRCRYSLLMASKRVFCQQESFPIIPLSPNGPVSISHPHLCEFPSRIDQFADSAALFSACHYNDSGRQICKHGNTRFQEACKAANDLVIESIKATEADTHCYGVNFEYALAKFRK